MIEMLQARKIDNFRAWREQMITSGFFGGDRELEQSGDLAELIGMTLGDGSIHVYERTEGLRIVLPSKRLGLVKRYEKLVEQVFEKKPSVIKRKKSECFDIRLYQKNISKRMGIPAEARAELEIKVPDWIVKNRDFVIRYLRGLYEAEGSFCVHKPTYTYKLLFANANPSMLDNVFNLMAGLGFHPHRGRYQIQISRKEEVYRAIELLQFRKY